MANRRELITELIEDHEYNAEKLLDSLVAAMSEQTLFDALKHVMCVEDWRHRVTKYNQLILSELDGEFETGASNHTTNNFILAAVNTSEVAKLIHKGTTAKDILEKYSFIDVDPLKVILIEAETYFEQVTRKD